MNNDQEQDRGEFAPAPTVFNDLTSLKHKKTVGPIESAMRERIVTDANGRKYITAEPLLHPPAAQPEPTPWRDMIVVTLVREGINKHRARELADHFAAQPAQEPVAYYHPRNGFYWAKPTSIFAPTVVDVPPMPLYAAAERNNG